MKNKTGAGGEESLALIKTVYKNPCFCAETAALHFVSFFV
jgi:hypothetical protein